MAFNAAHVVRLNVALSSSSGAGPALLSARLPVFVLVPRLALAIAPRQLQAVERKRRQPPVQAEVNIRACGMLD
jgi:hypothetical protein